MNDFSSFVIIYSTRSLQDQVKAMFSRNNAIDLHILMDQHGRIILSNGFKRPRWKFLIALTHDAPCELGISDDAYIESAIPMIMSMIKTVRNAVR